MATARCDECRPENGDAYFANFTPAALALICEGSLLRHALEVMAGIEAGILWAAVRSVERGEAVCPALSNVTSRMFEKTYRSIYRKLPRIAWEEVELNHNLNLLCVLPPKCEPGTRCLDHTHPVTAGRLMAEIIAKYDFEHAPNAPLRECGLEMKVVSDRLMMADGFVAGAPLTARGTIPVEKKPLYVASCMKAACVGAWLLQDVHVKAAMPGKEEGGELEHAGGEFFIPGPRPWLPSACKQLGVPEPDGCDIF